MREERRNAGLACRYLHHGDPYLGLGPFNLEVVNREPLVAVVRGACSGEEAGRIRDGATGRMKATPLVVAHGHTGERVTHNYTTLRTSKVVYQSEKRYSVLHDISARAELAMGVNILGTVLGRIEQIIIHNRTYRGQGVQRELAGDELRHGRLHLGPHRPTRQL